VAERADALPPFLERSDTDFMGLSDSIERVIRRLETRRALSEEDRNAIRALPFTYRTLEASTYMVREGEPPQICTILLSGFAYRHKITEKGARQILSLHLPGEFLDLQNSMLEVADHNVQTLTRAEIAAVPVTALHRLVTEHPAVARAMWIDTLVDAAIFREWLVNVGRRDSHSRIAHLLCEFALRLEMAGLASHYRYELPMTQEQIADCTGLTPVHVNRVLKDLGRQGLISRERRSVAIANWEGLSHAGDFNSRYLHYEEGGPGEAALAS